MEGSEEMRRCPPQAGGATWLPEMKLASWMCLPRGSMVQGFVGVTEAAAGLGRDLLRASLCSLQGGFPHKSEWDCSGGAPGEEGEGESGAPIHVSQDLLPWVLTAAGPGWC